MYVSLFTVAIPLNYTSEFRELFEVTTCIGLIQVQHNSLFLISTSSNRVPAVTQIFKDIHYFCGSQKLFSQVQTTGHYPEPNISFRLPPILTEEPF